MTCIIGLLDKENDCVWIGADSLASNEHLRVVCNQPKAFKHNNMTDIIIGSSATFRQIDILKYNTTLFDDIDNENIETDHKYMVTKFIPKLQEMFQSHKIENKGNFIVAIKNKLYEIQSEYSVFTSVDDYIAVGSGKYFAVGSLFTTKNLNMSPVERITLALESAEYHSQGVGKPYVILNTKDDNVITIE